MKKVLLLMVLSISVLFSAVNLQTASKKELMCIKGIGEKKAEAILEYRKSHKLNSPKDLIEIKGFGKGLIKNVKQNIQSVACSGKKGTKKSLKKDSSKGYKKRKHKEKDHSKKSKKKDTQEKNSKGEKNSSKGSAKKKSENEE